MTGKYCIIKNRTGKGKMKDSSHYESILISINTSDTNFPQPINGNNEKTTAILQMAMMIKLA